MTTFKDRFGREWTVELDNSMLADLRGAGLDLGKFTGDEKQAKELLGDLMRTMLNPEMLGRVLWITCGDAAQARNLDERDFAKGFNADALLVATDAVLFAVFDHVFRRAEFRALVRAELPKLWARAEREVAAKLQGSSYAG